MNANNRGIVLCFLIYISLCALIVSILEMPWLVVPEGSEIHINITESMSNTTAEAIMGNTSSMSNGIIRWNAEVPGYCGVSGFCWPFKDDDVMISMMSGEWGERCYQMDPILPITAGSDFQFNVVTHLPFYLSTAGAVFLLITWLISICACCNHDCGYCTIYSVIAVMLTFSGSVFLVGGVMLFVFGEDQSSCIQNICGDVENSFDLGDCTPGWSLFVAGGGLVFAYILAIVSCVLASKTPLASNKKPNQIVEVKPASSGRKGNRGQRGGAGPASRDAGMVSNL